MSSPTLRQIEDLIADYQEIEAHLKAKEREIEAALRVKAWELERQNETVTVRPKK